MKTAKIVLVGHVCIDHNKSEHASYTSWGSSVLYMGRSFQKQFGANPVVVSSYGPDLLPHLPEVNVYPAIPDQPYTLVYENDSSSGKRTQRCQNVEFAGPPPIEDGVIDALSTADIVVVATLLPNYPASYLRELLGHCREGALKVLCPQGYFRHVATDGRIEPREFAEASSIVPLFDLVMYSEEDSPVAYELAKQLKQDTDTAIVVTQSAQGATIIGKDSDNHIPTTPIAPEDIVDSVGCGDTFAAAVTYSYFESKDLPAAILDGHHTAGKKLLTVPGKD